MADRVASLVGSWTFILVQSFMILIWIIINVYGFWVRWDAYPFILLNLFMSFQAAYTAPIIMMSQNRMEEKDRERSIKDYETDVKAEKEIEALQKQIELLHEKVDRILQK